MRNRMRKVLSLCTVFLALTGCGSQAVVESSYYGEEYQQGTDYNYSSYYFLQNGQSMICTEQGYYFIAGGYLFFTDSAESQAVPLCFKTDCLHQEETDPKQIPNCDAFLGGQVTQTCFLGYYQDHIYTICLDKATGYDNLVEMKLDGSDRRVLYMIDNTNMPQGMFMHRGVIYFVNKQKNLDGESRYGLNAISVVSGSGEPVQVYTGVYKDGWIQNVLAYGNYVFFRDCYYTEESFDGSVLMYDIRTGESEKLLEGDNSSIYGIEDEGLLIRRDGQYYVYSLEDRTLSPSGKNYEAFLEAHPQWQCHCENADEDMALFTCYDKEADAFVTDLYVVDSQGEVTAVIPDMAWTVNGSYIFEEGGEEYLFRYSSSQVSEFFINVYAKKDLLQGIVAPYTILEAEDRKTLMPSYELYIGG